MPQVFTEGRIDFDKLRLALGDLADDPSTALRQAQGDSSGQAAPERYSFSWAGKRDAIRLLQVPSRATLIPCPEESVFNTTDTKDTTEEKENLSDLRALRGEFFSTQNLFIEGDNLEVLKLLYKPYFGRVKMIYIDPPYNTGNDFVYPDNFADPLETYLQLTGQKDSEGNLLTSNPETGGRYHSAWLSMMYPRLFLARQLLREDGVIFVSIDDTEVANLRLLMNEIFGEENFIATIIWQKKYSPQNDATYLSDMHDFILLFAKNKEVWRPTPLARTEAQDSAYKNPDNDPRGTWKATDSTCNKSRSQRPNLYYPITNPITQEEIYPLETRVWRYSRSVHEEKQRDNRLWWGPDGKNKVPAYKSFLSEVKQGRVPTTIWTYQEVGHNQSARQELNTLIEGNTFDTPKPTGLARRMLEIGTNTEDDIVLDFFAGSCTTAQAVLELNREDGGDRRFIMVQLPEPIPSPAGRGQGEGGFPTIAEIGKERIRRVVARMKKDREGQLALDTRSSPEDLGFKVFKLAASNYRQWDATQPDAVAYARQAELFADPLVEGWQPENVLYEVALKEGYGLNVEVASIHELTPPIWRVTDLDKGQAFYLTLAAKIALNDLRPLDLKKDDLFICRDAALDDEAAANLALQCRLKTI
ncbi:MAG: site-specific DNA-methyltransferase [Chloroflexota bacterium]